MKPARIHRILTKEMFKTFMVLMIVYNNNKSAEKQEPCNELDIMSCSQYRIKYQIIKYQIKKRKHTKWE